MSSRQPQPISEIIKEVFERKIEGRKIEERMQRGREIEGLWKKTVDKKAARHSRAVSLHQERLLVNVDNPAWVYELSLKKKPLLNKLNKSSRKYKISEIQFRLGKL